MKNSRLKRLISFAVLMIMLTACFDVPAYAEESISENVIDIEDEEAAEEEETVIDDAEYELPTAEEDEAVIAEPEDDEIVETVFQDDIPETEIEDEEECITAEVEGAGKKEKEPSVSSLSLITIPTKLIYRKGDDLDLTNGLVYVVYDNGTDAYLKMKAAMVSNYDKAKAGRQIVHINVGEQFVQYNVDVVNVEAGENSKYVVGDEGFPTLYKAMDWIKKDRNKTLDYEIIMFSDALIRTLPVVTKAKSLTITANTYKMEFYAVDKLTFGCDTVLNDLTVKCLSEFEKKNKYRTKMKIVAKKNLTLNNCDFISSGLTIKGRDKKIAEINKSSGIYRLNGFGKVTVNGNLEIKYKLSTKRLIMSPESRITLSSAAKLTVEKQFSCERDAEIVLGKNFVPIEINGNMGGTIKLKSDWPAAEGDLVIKLKYSDILPYFDIEGIMPQDGATYELVKEGTEARLYGHKFYYNGTSYTSWKSVISAVNKSGNKETPAQISLLGDVDIRGKMTMPKAKKMSELTVNGNGHEIVFTGNIKLVKNTKFMNIKLKGLDEEGDVNRYYIYKKKWELDISQADIGLGVVK
ncbi:MAG: bacterial Ig-like domain-containing protein [Lachnospiraceae bacterium]|nr:bacterial Ig-like domain-containing protein [Lachnospiraceae bacterium]